MKCTVKRSFKLMEPPAGVGKAGYTVGQILDIPKESVDYLSGIKLVVPGEMTASEAAGGEVEEETEEFAFED